MQYCYEVMKHKIGDSFNNDRCISLDDCMSRERAEEIMIRLNSTSNKLVNGKYRYYIRKRNTK